MHTFLSYLVKPLWLASEGHIAKMKSFLCLNSYSDYM